MLERQLRPPRQAVLLAVALAVTVSWTAWGEVVTLTVDGEKVELSYDQRYVTLQGKVVIIAQSEEDPARKIRIEADFVEGDLESGRFEALGNVLVVTPEASLRGESVHYEAATSEFKLKRAAVMVGLREVGGEKVYGYAYGQEIGQTNEILYILRGRFTTCDRPNPHYAVECKRVTYHPASGKVTVKGGALRLYGVRIPLFPRVSFKHGGRKREGPSLTPMVGYSGRDGVHLRWAFPLTSAESSTDAALHLRLTAKRGLRGHVESATPWGEFALQGMASHKEDVTNDLDELVTVSRLPELSLSREWEAARAGDSRLSGRLTLGRYREFGTAGEPNIKDDRAMAELGLTRNEDRWAEGTGNWWWVKARQAWYDGGDNYTDVEMAVGAGRRLGRDLTGALTLRHHAIGGQTPFEFDDVDIQTELMGRTDLGLGNGWGLGLLGRFDLRDDVLRDYEAELRKRVHCLTWVARYRDVGNRLGLGVEINGLWGNAQPYAQRAIEQGPPYGGG